MKNNDNLFNFTPVPMWVYDSRDLRILAANKAACKDYGYTSEQFLSMTLMALWVNEEAPADETIVLHKTSDGRILDVSITSEPLQCWDEHAHVIAALDITDKLRAKQTAELVDEFDLLERNVLAINSQKESSTAEVLATYLEGIERLFPQLACSVMRVKNGRIYDWSSPSLPASLRTEFDGIEISAYAGSCGTAAYLKEKIIVTDISDDKRWEAYKEITMNAGFLACWSYPLLSSDQQVMATFAIYSRESGAPTDLARMVIERATGLLPIILENRLFSEMLAETHKLMETGQELAQFGNWSWDITDNLVSWSDTLYAIYGINKNSFKATFEGYLERLHPDDRERIIGIIGQVQQTGKDSEFEERIIRPDGEVRFLRSWGTLKYDEDGRPVKMIGACLDISEWKKTERQLQKSNDRYEYISKASKDAVFDLDFAQDHVNWGDGLLRVFGYSVGEKFTFADWAGLVHPDDFNTLDTKLQATIHDPETTHLTAEYRLRHANGAYLYCEGTAYILRDDEGVATRMIGVIRDITERKVSAMALMASEKRYSDLFHLSPLPMWVYDVHTLCFLDVNDAAIRVYGYAKEEFLAMSIRDVMPEKSDTAIAHHFKKSGELMLVNTNGNSIVYEEHEARLIVAIDNTEKIQALEALETSEHRFKQLIQEGSDLIAILNEAGNFKYVSPAAERILGFTVEELTGKDGLDFIHNEDRDMLIAGFKELEHTKRVELAPFRIIGHQQQVLWMETTLTDMRADEAIAGVIANARDVTHRVISETENKQMLERYNVVAKATSDTIWDCNLQTEQINWNHGIENVFGYTELKNTYTWWQEHVHPDDLQKINDIVIAKMKSGDSRWSSEYRFRCADGSYKFVFDRGFLLFDEEGNPVRMIGAMQDITERINYIREIEQHNSRLKDIAWTQTHLVRAPLARIIGISNLLKSGENDLETSDKLLDYLETSANELDQVVKTIVEKSQKS